MYCRMIVLVIILLSIGHSTVHAQEVTPLEIEGVKHYLRFTPAQSPTFRNATQAIIREVLPALTAYTGWTAPSVVLHFAPPADVDASGDPFSDLHGRYVAASTIPFIDLPTDVPEQVCAISAYSIPGGDQYRFLLAVELAQCMMYANVPAAMMGDFDTDLVNRWWGEGAAYVLAEMFSGATEADWVKVQEAFVANQAQTLMKADTGAYYFWSYVLLRSGDSGFMALLEGMPESTENQYAYLKDNLLPDDDIFMHDFAKAIAMGELAHVPDMETLEHVTVLDSLPDRAKITPEPFAIGFERVNVSGLTPDGTQGVTFEATELDAAGIMLSTLAGEAVTEATLQEICGTDGKFPFIYSRAVTGDLSDTTEANLKYEALACDPPVASADDPACVVGRWRLTGLPAMSGTTINIIGGSRTVTIGEDGTLQDVYTAFQMGMYPANGPEGIVSVEGIITSQITIGEEGVVTEVRNMRPAVTVLVSIRGSQVDMSAAANEFLGNAGNITNGVQLSCLGDTLRITPVGVTEIDGSFTLTRIDGAD